MSTTKPPTEQDVVRTGFLKKAKRMKKKFFVLRGESDDHPARLEYYDSDRKWRNGNPPKRYVVLKTCFNINKKYDSKNRNVLALYTKDETFALCTETEADLNSWLKDLLLHQRGEDVVDGDEPKPNFEHVWEVNITKKCLGNKKNILGPYRLCLTAKTLKLVKVTSEEEPETHEFILNQIRRCGNAGCYFFMEVGRSAVTGAGELWMMSEDALIAQNIHEAILGAMNSLKDDHKILFRPRTQSSSATETPKTSSGISRRLTNPVSMTHAGRDRQDGGNLRKRTISDNQSDVASSVGGNGRNGSQLPCDTAKATLNVAASPPTRNPSPVPPMLLEYPGFKNPDDYEVTNCLTDLANLNQPLMQDACVQKSLDESYVEHLSESDKANRNGRPDYFEMAPQTQILSSSPGPRTVRSSMGGSSINRTLSQSSSASVGSKVMLVSEWRRARSSNAGSVTSERTISESSSVNQEYFDMNSPVSASWIPGDILGTFSSMGDSQISKSSGSHTRSSSLCDGEDTVDGCNTGDYLSMAPQADNLSKLPYMEMKGKGSYPGSLTRSTRDNGILSSPMSACSLASSFTSGTASAHAGTPPSLPSFRETYTLEKVTSYVSATPDDDSGMRKTRAYSVGSKLEAKSRKKRLEVLEVPQELPRVRSFSMGNNISGGTAKPAKPFPPPSQPIVLTKPGKKSLSAPMLGTSPLSSSWSGNTGTFFKHLFGSMTSSGRSSDILELDVAEPHASSIDSLSSSYLEDRTRKESFSSHDGGSRASSTSGVVLSRNRSDSRTSSLLGRASGKLASMKKDRKRERLESVPQGRDQDYIEVDCQSPVTEDYMPMDGSMTASIESRSSRKTTESERVPRSRKVSQTIPDIHVDTTANDYLTMEYRKESIEEKNDYIEMQPRIRVTEPEDAVILRKKCNNDYLLMGSPSSGTVTPSNLSCRNSRTEDEFDDYMEMSFKETGTLKVRPERAKSLIGDDSGPQRKSSKTQNTFASISNILSRRSSKKEQKKMPSPSTSSTLPRPAKSAPPSQYPSLKRTMSKGSKDDNLCDYLPMSVPKTSPTQLPSPVSPEPDYVDLAMSPPPVRPNSSLPICIQPVKPRGSPLGLSPKEGVKVEVQKVKGSDYTGFVSIAKVASPDTPNSSELFLFEACKEERSKKDYVNMDFTKTRKLSEPSQLLSMINPLAMSPIPEKSQSSSVETLTSPADFVEGRRDSRISSVTDLLEKAATSMQLSPKRHCSGDPPVRKTSAIFRSNSYHPMNKCRSASVLPSLSDIPDGKALNAFEVNSKPAKSPPFSIVSGFFQSKLNAAHTSRSSSSSITSLGEEEEIKSMIWAGGNPVALSPHLKESSSTTPSSQSRPSSTSSEKELNYATLDLPPPKEGQRSRPCSTGPEPVMPVLSYAQIDFTRHEGLRQIASSQKPREKELS